jgi:hypothetical protein
MNYMTMTIYLLNNAIVIGRDGSLQEKKFDCLRMAFGSNQAPHEDERFYPILSHLALMEKLM